MRLVQTSTACPEQYDVYDNSELVGYFRLRHGHFSVACPDVNGVIVYEAEVDGDGSFENNEREFYLNAGMQAVKDWINNVR